jgi:hypothetical protein
VLRFVGVVTTIPSSAASPPGIPSSQARTPNAFAPVRLAKERLDRLEQAIEEFLPYWPFAPMVEALAI